MNEVIMKEEKKKIGLIGSLLMGIGCIVGAGVFGSLPTVAQQLGSGVIYALLGAAFVVILRSISRMYTCAALPISGSSFMYATKLFNPYTGALITINGFLMPTMVSLFGILFSMYFQPLFPNLGISATTISVILLLIFTVIAWFGNKSTVTISNVIVCLLLSAIAVYVFLGLPNIDAANVSFMSIIKPGIALSSIGAAIGVLTSSLSGASAVAEIADDIAKPGRNVPLALILCPVIVAFIYILMAIVTIGVIPSAEVETLSQVASHFMSPAILTFFIVGGPIAGIITSLVPVALACVAIFDYSAKSKVLPSTLSKQNKHGVPYLSLFIVSGIAIVICATGATFGIVMTIFSFTNTLGELPNTLAPIFAYKKYPLTCDNSSVHMSSKVAKFLSIITFGICLYLCIQMILTLDVTAIIGIIAVYVVGYIYFFIRVKYLKNRQGIDLIAEMNKPYGPWEEKEASYK